MQINRLALKNFKCFKEVDVSFSKITLLTGENSSGKSSLIYGILAPLQSIKMNTISFPLSLSLNGHYVNMGGFADISSNHNLKNQIGIELTVEYNSIIISIITKWDFNHHSKSPKLAYLKSKFRTSFLEIIQNEDLSYIVNSSGAFSGKALSLLNTNESLDTYDLHGLLFYSFLGTLYDETLPDSEFNFNFISSFRLQPERTYYQSLASNKVDKFGSGYIDQILEWNDSQSKELYELVNILKYLKILYDIKPHRLVGGRFEIKVKVKSRSKWESLSDVGFGISQFLPIIVADLQLSDNSTLIMSQPEIHLHPSVQANLGDYLVKQVNERNKNYIVETHSEYLLNRMRLLIVKGEIKPEDVAVYYFENSIKDGSIAHRIEFTKDGQILNAPKGFFETYMIDTMDIALNA